MENEGLYSSQDNYLALPESVSGSILYQDQESPISKGTKQGPEGNKDIYASTSSGRFKFDSTEFNTTTGNNLKDIKDFSVDYMKSMEPKPQMSPASELDKHMRDSATYNPGDFKHATVIVKKSFHGPDQAA